MEKRQLEETINRHEQAIARLQLALSENKNGSLNTFCESLKTRLDTATKQAVEAEARAKKLEAEKEQLLKKCKEQKRNPRLSDPRLPNQIAKLQAENTESMKMVEELQEIIRKNSVEMLQLKQKCHRVTLQLEQTKSDSILRNENAKLQENFTESNKKFEEFEQKNNRLLLQIEQTKAASGQNFMQWRNEETKKMNEKLAKQKAELGKQTLDALRAQRDELLRQNEENLQRCESAAQERASYSFQEQNKKIAELESSAEKIREKQEELVLHRVEQMRIAVRERLEREIRSEMQKEFAQRETQCLNDSFVALRSKFAEKLREEQCRIKMKKEEMNSAIFKLHCENCPSLRTGIAALRNLVENCVMSGCKVCQLTSGSQQQQQQHLVASSTSRILLQQPAQQQQEFIAPNTPPRSSAKIQSGKGKEKWQFVSRKRRAESDLVPAASTSNSFSGNTGRFSSTHVKSEPDDSIEGEEIQIIK